MKCLVATLVLLSSASLLAQKAGVLTVSITTHSRSAAASNSATQPRPDVALVLAELERTSAATRYDIAHLGVDKWRSGWQTAWLRPSTHKQEARELALSLKTNLSEAIPELISEVQDSPASVSATFKLYNDVSAVAESVDSLEQLARSFGKRDDSSSLHSDYLALGRIRQTLASYIQLTADALEPLNGPEQPGTVAYGTVLSASKLDRRATSAR